MRPFVNDRQTHIAHSYSHFKINLTARAPTTDTLINNIGNYISHSIT